MTQETMYFTLATTLLTLVGLTALAMFLLFRQYSRTHGKKYNAENQQIELEMLRRSFEAQIYRLEDRLAATEARWRDMNHLVLAGQSVQSDHPAVAVPTAVEFLGLSARDLKLQRDLVFVLVPFHPEFEDVFHAIVSSCQKVGLRALRGDEEFIQGEIFSHILRQIAQSRLVIAVLDGRNPNVFYELGLAQAMGKQTLLVARSPEEMPFDVRTKRLVLYRDVLDLHNRLATELARGLAQS